MLTFAAAVLFLLVTPGPGVLSTAGVGSAFGFRPGLTYVVGLFVGTNLVSAAVISGVAALVVSSPAMRALLTAASAAYLAYLAARIALAGSKIAFVEARTPPGAVAGIALQLINPKAYVVNATLFGGFAFHPQSFFVETATKLVILNLIWIPIHLGWLWAGVALRRLDLGPGVQRGINVGMAAAMLAVVALALLSGLERP